MAATKTTAAPGQGGGEDHCASQINAPADSTTDGLSRPGTKAGRLQRAVLDVIREHEADGMLPTNGRFIFYELEQQGIVPKHYFKPDGKTLRPRQPLQDITDALTRLREIGLVAWTDIVDETRTIHVPPFYPSVIAAARALTRHVRLNAWGGDAPPLIITESLSLAGVLRDLAYEYVVPITSTRGQCRGFLITEVVPILEDEQRVLYLGDFDLSGGQIEEHTREVLAQFVDLEWERLAITREQIEEHDLPIIAKRDRRYRDGRLHEAVETESLTQRVVVELVRNRLDELLPEPLERVRIRERRERAKVLELLGVTS